MKTRKLFQGKIMIGISIALAMSLITLPALAAAPKIYKMEGKISAIDLQDNTVVIQVPITEKNIFTVAGPLAKNATLKIRDKKEVTLKDFKVGEKVVVEWEPLPDGHLIKRLEAK
jgi:hypothetical protein